MKVAQNAQKPRGKHLSRPRRLFWDPLAAILDFAGVAGGERASPSPLGWYYKIGCLGTGKYICFELYDVLQYNVLSMENISCHRILCIVIESYIMFEL